MSAETVAKNYHRPKRPITLFVPPFDLPPEPPRLIAAPPVRHLPKGPGADWDGEAA